MLYGKIYIPLSRTDFKVDHKQDNNDDSTETYFLFINCNKEHMIYNRGCDHA